MGSLWSANIRQSYFQSFPSLSWEQHGDAGGKQHTGSNLSLKPNSSDIVLRWHHLISTPAK